MKDSKKDFFFRQALAFDAAKLYGNSVGQYFQKPETQTISCHD